MLEGVLKLPVGPNIQSVMLALASPYMAVGSARKVFFYHMSWNPVALCYLRLGPCFLFAHIFVALNNYFSVS